MTPEQQRIAIAEACGYTKAPGPYLDGWQWTDPKGNPCGSTEDLPDYLNDLNACREFEHWLEYKCENWHWLEPCDSAPEAYMQHLRRIVGDDDWRLVCATAAQRAEAFLRTIGKWKE